MLALSGILGPLRTSTTSHKVIRMCSAPSTGGPTHLRLVADDEAVHLKAQLAARRRDAVEQLLAGVRDLAVRHHQDVRLRPQLDIKHALEFQSGMAIKTTGRRSGPQLIQGLGFRFASLAIH